MNEVLMIGGAVYDITARILGETVPRDSNPSRVWGSCGGVGRNIAASLSALSVHVRMMTVLGSDAFSQQLAASCEQAGIDLSPALRREGAAPTYLSVLDRNGELVMAASDLSLLEALPPEELCAETIERAPAVFADANLTEEQLCHIAAHCLGRLFSDAVSVVKGRRLRRVLPALDTLKVNRTELASVSGLPAENRDEILAACRRLRAEGVGRVVVTLGAEGSCSLSDAGFTEIPAIPVQVVNVNGAGDAFAAAMVWALLKGLPEEKVLRAGAAAASLALASAGAVSDRLSAAYLEEKLRGY